MRKNAEKYDNMQKMEGYIHSSSRRCEKDADRCEKMGRMAIHFVASLQKMREDAEKM